MQDYLIRATAADGSIRAFAATTTNLVEEARRRHDTFPTATAALGRTLTAGLIMGATLKGDDTLTLRIFGNGPLGGIITQADARGKVRGYVQEPHTHLPSNAQGKLDVGGAVGKEGFVYVTRDIGLKEPYTGSVPLVSGEIGEDLAHYYVASEQIPTVVALGVLVDTDNHVLAAGGYIIQLMPGADEEVIFQLEQNLKEAAPVSALVELGYTPEKILEEVLKGFDLKVLEKKNVSFTCTCTKEGLEKVLISLGVDELEDMIREQGGAELICHFCSDKFEFDRAELEKLIQEAQ
ncbi:MAG: Hsp33 family molecular chaperone HslO [Clostridia bacterium]|nr:Hsp33 family molecular chaperone HslO [Clostridia bacterium]